MKKYELALSSWDEKEIDAIQRVISSGNFSMGKEVSSYEEAFSKFFGSKYTVMVNSGSSANLLMMASLFFTKDKNRKLERGDEIVVPSVSWSTTYSPLQQLGLKVVFVDIDKNTLNMDLSKLKAAVSPKTKAIFAVNLLGNPNEFSEIKRIIGTRDITLIEDNCESMGAVYEGKKTGTIGLMGTFSSFFSHHISTMEGGCIVTDDEEIYHILLSLRAHGWTRNLPVINHVTNKKSSNPFEESFNFVLPGYNLRPLEMSGAIGKEQLNKLNDFVRIRRRNAKLFYEAFSDDPDFTIQKEIGKSSWFGFSLVLREESKLKRNKVIESLEQNNIESRPIVSGNFLKFKQLLGYFDYEISGSIDNAQHLDSHGFFVGNHHIDLSEQIINLRRILS